MDARSRGLMRSASVDAGRGARQLAAVELVAALDRAAFGSAVWAVVGAPPVELAAGDAVGRRDGAAAGCGDDRVDAVRRVVEVAAAALAEVLVLDDARARHGAAA